MQLLFLVIKRIELVDEIMRSLAQAGIRGGTVIDSVGMAKSISTMDNLPMIGVLRSILSGEDAAQKDGAYEVKFWVCTTFESLKQLVTGNVGVKQLSGPVGIVNMVDTTYNESKSYGVFIVIAQFLNIGILLSANLGVMNLLPLPALDGGRLVFLLIEAIRRKRIPPEKEGYVHLAGMALLMILMVVVMYNDIARIFF